MVLKEALIKSAVGGKVWKVLKDTYDRSRGRRSIQVRRPSKLVNFPTHRSCAYSYVSENSTLVTHGLNRRTNYDGSDLFLMFGGRTPQQGSTRDSLKYTMRTQRSDT